MILETTLVPGSDGPVPVSFGFHPYFGLPGLPRAQWRLKLPAMQRLVLDRHEVPTSEEEPFNGFEAQLGEVGFDDGFALMAEHASFSVSGAGRQVTIELLAGYRYAQIFAPKESDHIVIEPMTAPTSALTRGRGLRPADSGEKFKAMFRIRVEAVP